MDIEAWLSRLNLGQYAQTFRSNGIDRKALEQLTSADLVRFGVSARHRKRILEAASGLDPLFDSDNAVSMPAPRTLNIGAERRRLTVMFCDLVASTQLSVDLDPEDLRDLINAFFSACSQHIEAAGGYVAQYLGDGMVVYFGYPQAQEDDAQRAVSAALSIVAAAPAIETTLGRPLSVRIGIATGDVVVGDIRANDHAKERAVIGETPNLAARLQSAAEPNEIIISQSTHARIVSAFECEAKGPLELKGIAEARAAWRVLAPKAGSGLLKLGHDGLTPLYDREKELAIVLSHWRRRHDGEAQAVGLIGPPGIGKSRLLAEVRAALASEDPIWLEGASAQVFSSTPFYAVARLIRAWLARDTNSGEDLDRLHRSLSNAGVEIAHAAPLIAEMIGLPAPHFAAPLELDADTSRQLLITALIDWIVGVAANRPVVIAIEDLHWSDPSTRELLERLMQSQARAKPFIIYTARQEFAPVWNANPAQTHVVLRPLSDAALSSIVEHTLGRTLPEPVMRRLLIRAEGVPLFAEEIARLVEARGGGDELREIPNSILDLFTASLDQLGSAKEIVQIASVVGAEFPFRLLHAVVGGDARKLRTAVNKLVKAGVFTQRPDSDQPLYGFRHALIQDAAYVALLRSQRTEIHRRSAVALQSGHGGSVNADVIAQHWASAGELALAAAAWREGGDLARKRRAYGEAQQVYQRALDVLPELDETAERDMQELALQNAFASVLQITRGYSAAETEAATARALALAARGGDITAQLAQGIGAWAVRSSAGDYQSAAELADRVMQLACADGRPSLLAHAYMVQMTSSYRRGEIVAAEEYFNTGLPYFDSPAFTRQPGSIAQTFGNGARVAWILAKKDETDRRIARALSHGESSENPYEHAFALYMSAIMTALTGDFAATCTLAEQSIELSERQGYPQFSAISRVALGRAQARLGKPTEGLALIRSGIDAMNQTGSRVALTMYLTWLAEAEVLCGNPAAARERYDQALTVNPQEVFFRPETLRQRGVLRLKARDSGGRDDLTEAAALAQRMGARRFHEDAVAELRALVL